MPKKAETLFKEKVMRDLKQIPKIWFFKTQEISRMGILDLIICLKGRFIALELKMKDGKLTPLQAYTLQEILNAEGEAFVVTPETWPEQRNLLKAL